jgi:DKNYY family
LNDYFTRAEDKIFFCFKELPGADAVSFTVIRENLGKDKIHVYFKGQIVDGAHSATFQLLAGCVGGAYYDSMSYICYAKDSEMAYFIDGTAKTVKPIKSKSLSQFRFEVVKEQRFCFDNEYRYHFAKRTKIAI